MFENKLKEKTQEERAPWQKLDQNMNHAQRFYKYS